VTGERAPIHGKGQVGKEKGHKKRECPRLQTGQPGDRTVTRPGNGQ